MKQQEEFSIRKLVLSFAPDSIGYLSKVALVVSLLTFLSASLPAQSNVPAPAGVLVEGEDLIYNVRYGFINLGQVRIRVLNSVRTTTYLAYNGIANIQSYSGVPFVNLNATFESTIDSAVFSHHFVGKVKDGKFWEFARYRFDYDAHRVFIEVGHRDTLVEKRDTLPVESLYNDGLSLFFFARQNLFSGKKMNIPTLIKEEKVNTYIDFMKKRESVEIDAVDYPVDVIGFEGTAEFVGVFGMTGDFKGWFSNDDARVPILAKMKVIIGSITIELMEWKRPGWLPPRGN